ncbi:hypothetical protein C8R44DRAFT_320928 [Mycena epipterygia]|nr:hypothetical protein C8R44DRAFT_320928 [Mycena epipterygia]
MDAKFEHHHCFPSRSWVLNESRFPFITGFVALEDLIQCTPSYDVRKFHPRSEGIALVAAGLKFSSTHSSHIATRSTMLFRRSVCLSIHSPAIIQHFLPLQCVGFYRVANAVLPHHVTMAGLGCNF